MIKKPGDYSINIGSMKRGPKNNIADVRGVKVGHKTYDQGSRKTGITVIYPKENIFKEKLIAASHVINGFGKSVGLIQIDELGSLESPIVLTNTLAVGRMTHSLVKHMLELNEDIGDTTATVNPVVCECNDGYLNDIRDIFLSEEDFKDALKDLKENFQEGNVGAGTGMVCYGLKGGIGSSSRIVKIGSEEYTIGVLCLTNFGRLEDLLVDNKPLGEKISQSYSLKKEDQGSIITIVATDLPLSHRQLKRLIKRVETGIAKTGSFTSNGSGEIVIGFSTANIISHYQEEEIQELKILSEKALDKGFKGVKEASEEAIISSLINSNKVTGRKGRKVKSLREFLS